MCAIEQCKAICFIVKPAHLASNQHRLIDATNLTHEKATNLCFLNQKGLRRGAGVLRDLGPEEGGLGGGSSGPGSRGGGVWGGSSGLGSRGGGSGGSCT